MEQIQQIQPEIPPIQPIPQASNGFKLSVVIIIAILTFLLGGVSVYFLSAQQNKPSDTIIIPQITQQPPSPTQISFPPTEIPANTIVPTSLPTSSLPIDWTYKQSNICNVKIPLPPNKTPYYNDDGKSNSFWQFEEYETSMFIFNTTARVIYRASNEASGGYVAGDVEVICTPNTTGYTTETLIKKLESDLAATIKSKRNGTMWEKNVMIVKFQGGMFDDSDHYIFATDKNIYLVRKISQSQNQFVNETTDKIFENLQFE